MHLSRSYDRASGLCRVWDTVTNKWVTRHPIDVREGIRVGSLAHAPPEEDIEPDIPTWDEVQQASVDTLRKWLVLHAKKVNLEAAQSLDEARQLFIDAVGITKPSSDNNKSNVPEKSKNKGK